MYRELGKRILVRVSDMNKKNTGTTTVGIVTKDGVVLGTEHRATMDYIIAHKVAKKLYQIDRNLGMTTAGLVGDIQVLVRYARAEAALYRLKRNQLMSVESLATLLSNILNSTKYFPYWVSILVGGYDNRGYRLFSVDAAGGAIEDKYAAAGSGSLFVYGVLEDRYREGLTLEEGIEIAVRGIRAAMSRDAASGDGIEIATITKEEGFKYVSEEVIKRYL